MTMQRQFDPMRASRGTIMPSADSLAICLAVANRHAQRLVRRLHLPLSEAADVRQELLLDLVARLRFFDPVRGSFGAFAETVMAHRGASLARKARRERLLFGAMPVSLDEPLPGGGSRGDAVIEDDGLAALLGQPVDAVAGIERRLDLERGLGCLAPADARLCASLASASISDIATAGGGARSTLFRRVKEIRLCLMAAGLQAA